MTPVGRLPLTIVTGFLGSGKTTVLRRVLPRPEMENSFVLVNEIADIGVDQRLLNPVNGSVCLVKGGCICCAARDELRSALLDLIETGTNASGISRIILETSGMANPGPLIETIGGHPVLSNRIRVTGVLTLVDCANAESNFRHYSEFSNQVACADHILMTKTDIADEQTIEAVAHMIRGLNPFAEIIADESCLVAALQGGASSVASVALSQHCDYTASPLPHSDIRTFCISLEEEACDWTDFAIWLSLLVHAHGRSILRIKGVLDLGRAARPVAINCVQELVYFPEHLDDQPGMDRARCWPSSCATSIPRVSFSHCKLFSGPIVRICFLLKHRRHPGLRTRQIPLKGCGTEWKSAGSRMSTDSRNNGKRVLVLWQLFGRSTGIR